MIRLEKRHDWLLIWAEFLTGAAILAGLAAYIGYDLWVALQEALSR